MSWHIYLWVYSVSDSLAFVGYLLSHIKDVFDCNHLKYLLISFLFLIFF